jgi:hypothetical protein
MYKTPVSEIKEKVIESGKLSSEEFEEKIKTKINDLSGLISPEGAAHIIANELGITLAVPSGERIKIKKLASGMNNISLLAKVLQKWEVREFDKGSYKGKVCSLLIADETGNCRFTLWNDQVDEIKDVKEADILLIHGGYVKENRGKNEFHLGRGGSFELNPEGEELNDVKKLTGTAVGGFNGSFNRKQITALEGNEEGVELFGTVVQVFDPRFFNVHPETGKRIYDDDESGVEPAISYVMNLILDDGSSTIRCVFWKNQVNNLLGCDEARMAGYKEDLSTFEDEKTDLLGEQIVLKGRVKHNEMFDRLEFSVQFVEKADVEKEIANVKSEAETAVRKAEEKVNDSVVVEETVEVAVETPELAEAVELSVSKEAKAEEIVETPIENSSDMQSEGLSGVDVEVGDEIPVESFEKKEASPPEIEEEVIV